MKKVREKKLSLSNLKTGASLAALVAAVATFVILMQVEKSVLTQYEKGIVYTASKAIAKGQMITEENYMQYMTQREMDKNMIPDTALTEPTQVRGMAAAYDVEEGVLLTGGMFEELDEILAGMEEPVIAGVKAEDIYQVAGGMLRAGDRIHIYTVRDGKAVLAWEEVYVQQVFDASGKGISNTDSSTAGGESVPLTGDLGKWRGQNFVNSDLWMCDGGIVYHQ